MPDGHGVLFDPFVGSGTTLVAAAKLGVTAVGNDLDPVAALMARCRIATDYDSKAVMGPLLRKPKKREHGFLENARRYYHDDDLSYANAVFAAIQEKVGSPEGELLSTLLDDSSGCFDSEVVALTAMIFSGPAAAKIVRGSNPVWYRHGFDGEDIET